MTPRRGTPRTGHVIWKTEVDDREVGMAWDWICLQRDVVVMADPMQVTTNVTLLHDESGAPLSDSELLCCLHSVIHSLSWQDKISSR